MDLCLGTIMVLHKERPEMQIIVALKLKKMTISLVFVRIKSKIMTSSKKIVQTGLKKKATKGYIEHCDLLMLPAKPVKLSVEIIL